MNDIHPRPCGERRPDETPERPDVLEPTLYGPPQHEGHATADERRFYGEPQHERSTGVETLVEFIHPAECRRIAHQAR